MRRIACTALCLSSLTGTAFGGIVPISQSGGMEATAFSGTIPFPPSSYTVPASGPFNPDPVFAGWPNFVTADAHMSGAARRNDIHASMWARGYVTTLPPGQLGSGAWAEINFFVEVHETVTAQILLGKLERGRLTISNSTAILLDTVNLLDGEYDFSLVIPSGGWLVRGRVDGGAFAGPGQGNTSSAGSLSFSIVVPAPSSCALLVLAGALAPRRRRGSHSGDAVCS